MLAESSPWKRDLIRESSNLQKQLLTFAVGTRRLSDSLAYSIERFCFTAAFIIRKLLSDKLSQELESSSIRVRAFDVRRRRYRRKSDEHEIMEKYSFTQSAQRDLSLRKLCDILIHSQVFTIAVYEDRHLAIMVNSDKTRNELYEVDLAALTALAIAVGNDDVVYWHGVRDPKTREMKTLVKSRKLPPTTGLARR